MMRISDLPTDLVGEIFSRVPLTSLSMVRLTCRTWNAFSKKQILGKKAARKSEYQEFMTIISRVCSLRFDLQGILNDEYLFDPSMKHISKPNIQVQFSKIFHCDGLLLCLTINHLRLLVWNPYLGQIRWIQPPRKKESYTIVNYALGYDNNHNHKIMRHSCGDENNGDVDVYDFSSDTWRVHDVYLEADVCLSNFGVSVNGNTYFHAEVITIEYDITDAYLLCFDFTTEQFGSPLRLPFPGLENFPLYWVRDEKLVVYNHGYDHNYEIIKIWVTTTIEPNVVSWNTFLRLDLRPINCLRNDFGDEFAIRFFARSFFIDEEKKVVVLFDETTEPCRYQMAYIFGEDGYYKSVNMGVGAQNRSEFGKLVCSSYVPSLVQLKINQHGKRKERDE